MELLTTVVCYVDSSFTLPHDVVSTGPKVDGRGTTSHLGIAMQGLESRRHLNFSQRGEVFTRKFVGANSAELKVGVVGDQSSCNRASISQIIFDTSFFTRNNVYMVYRVTFMDELTKSTNIVATNISLKGDSVFILSLSVPTIATRIKLEFSEGGLCRLRFLGQPVEQLPRKKNVLEGATIFGVTDSWYGDPSLVLRPTREGKVMNGWETCRHSLRQRLGLCLLVVQFI
eukprot:TRINITY_DN80_c0_g3_i9.p1 TRINITY_DN80_c0_g3~~TRINITY_DN80_c0_g3_i9.p1  ORF type:complete len:229 (-),score=27.39 TRINITY_DN80_c0_g3_i9:665-1351(-)